MKPPAFDYLRAGSVSDALAALSGEPESKIIAGGQSLLPLLNFRLARPSVLIDIGSLRELDRVFDDQGQVVLGALVRHATVEHDPLLRRRVPLASVAAGHIGHVGIRNRGTLGGSVAHADPSAEMPAVLVALGATVHLESSERGRRDVAAEDFFVSVYTTVAEPDEMLTWVSIPTLGAGQGWGFAEFAPRHGDYALAGAACVVSLAGDGSVASVRAGLLSAGERPMVRTGTHYTGEVGSEPLWRAMAEEWTRDLDLSGDDPDYRRTLHQEALVSSLSEAHTRAATGAP